MSRAFTRAELDAMGPQELADNADAISAWAAAGAVDGQAPPDIKRPDGHVFTREELSTLTVAEFDANADAIHRQLAAGTIR
ncbi:hypothetical protein [Blastococcus saxobsidens]|uniref:Uncharacterized protein n=1 Tax=Blastococcus saxobsidens TaxID=138336 RepID=A0A4Q7Y3N9_9ACTN|nr:hypothetical protein [Blastococcus saxobsidens]RZU31158.1 hypothetical protein BKA19_0806 [Blastococcus saxobsidens]